MKHVFRLLLSLIMITVMISSVKAQPFSASGTPNLPLDGNVEASEWADADTAAFGPITVGAQTITGTFYVMNDGTNLYMAMVINGDDDFTSGDGFRAYFDNDNGGETTLEQGDDYIAAWDSSSFGDAFYDTVAMIAADDSPSFGGTVDGQAAGSRQGSSNHFELSHPLDSTDNNYDFSLSAGDSVGFAIQVYVDGSFRNIGIGSVATSMSWEEYNVAQEPEPEPEPEASPVGGVTSPINKLVVLTPYLALAGVIAAASTIFIIKRRKD